MLVVSGPGRSRDAAARKASLVELLPKAERALTPPAFAEALIALAKHSREMLDHRGSP